MVCELADSRGVGMAYGVIFLPVELTVQLTTRTGHMTYPESTIPLMTALSTKRPLA